jgi:hypothetical protein
MAPGLGPAPACFPFAPSLKFKSKLQSIAATRYFRPTATSGPSFACIEPYGTKLLHECRGDDPEQLHLV